MMIVRIEGSDDPVGHVQLKNIDHVNSSVELGFCVATENQSRGIRNGNSQQTYQTCCY